MKGIYKNPVVAALSSLKLSAFLMAVVAFASARGTFIESAVGRDGAYDVIYDAWWFEAVLALLCISLVLLFFKRWPYRPRQFGFMLVHMSIVVILVSAGITRWFGYEGIMSIREGSSSDFIFSNHKHVTVSSEGSSADMRVRLWKAGANKLQRKVELGGQKYTLAVTEYWPRFTEKWTEGPGGPAALQYGLLEEGRMNEGMLLAGERATVGQAEMRFLEGPFGGEMATSRYGDLRLRIGGETCAVPVQPAGDAQVTCGGYRFRITEFQTKFQVGGSSDPEGPLVNPMIRVAITAPDGRQGERLLFAFHPDFSMGHSGGQESFADLDMVYQVNRGVEFARGGATGLQGRASFALTMADMQTQSLTEIPAGTVFDVQKSFLYRNDENGFSLVPANIFSSVVKAPAFSDSGNDPAAARVVLRDAGGAEVANAICVEQDRPVTVQAGGRAFELSYGPRIVKLPYTVTLDDFVLKTYPGSDNPATYESYVSLDDPAMGISGKKVHIYMNYPMNHRGSKHFQSSYDRDRLGTVLSVNHDPGKLPTYFGYFLISLGFLLIILKDLLWPVKGRKATVDSGAAGKAGALAGAGLVAALALLGPAGALAQAHDPNDGQDHSGHNHGPVGTGFVALSDPAREAASRLVIQDYNGRMKPLDTLAREMVMKVAKRTKFEGRQPVDQYLSWALNPNFWWDKPLIQVKNPGVRQLLGVDATVTHVSAASLFDAQGRYRLTEAVEQAHRTPDRERSKTQRQLISFDERFEMLYMTFRGATLRLFPIPNDANHTWQEIEQVLPRLDASQRGTYQAAFDGLARGVQTGDNAAVTAALTAIDGLQHQYGGMVIPSNTRLNAELFYNRAHLFSWMMLPLLGAFMILMAVYIWNLFRNRNRRLSFTNPFYSAGVALYAIAFVGMLAAYTLRWVASGRAPLSNGHESLLFISLAVALAGLIFELVYRLAVPASLGGLLTTVVIGVSMLSTFDPAIGPLVPVLVSYWLNIHVTIITASYGFLGLAALVGMLVLVLFMFKGRGREHVRDAIATLDNLNKHIIIAGLGLLTIGTLLGGVWANESWGRYWGWDPKETWALITILVYAVVLHFRWIPAMRSLWLNATVSMAAVSSVVMTYFGVNYFLSGLHSYAAGEPMAVPSWVYIGVAFMAVLAGASGLIDRSRQWGKAD
ncbi:MAG: cytochrome c biogenesis protein CcsA [bacterium]|nr:cytochrome c biogenesis protein CcsA [bacterium]